MVSQLVLHIVTLFMGLMVAALLGFTTMVLLRRRTILRSRRSYQKLFSDFISEIIICEGKDDLQATMDAAPPRIRKALGEYYGRRVLLSEILSMRVHLSGQAAENLKWLYEHAGLELISLEKFYAKRWDKKAAGIQQLARMDQKQTLRKVYRATDHDNIFVRNEAQLAVVSFVGFEGLRFLSFIKYPLTQWQQLSLLLQLNEQQIDSARLRPWLQVANATVQEFALRLIEKYKCFDLQEEVIAALASSHRTVRFQALKTLAELFEDTCSPGIISHFASFTAEEKLLALQMMKDALLSEHLLFLGAVTRDHDHRVRAAAADILLKLQLQLIADKQEDIIYIPSLEKEIV